MEPTIAETPAPAPLTTKLLLARINARLSMLRGWLSHDHTDKPYWWARRRPASHAQHEQVLLRRVANLLHVERATSRGRIHGTHFATLDDQRAWLRDRETTTFYWESDYIGTRHDATLVQLRDGQLPA